MCFLSFSFCVLLFDFSPTDVLYDTFFFSFVFLFFAWFVPIVVCLRSLECFCYCCRPVLKSVHLFRCLLWVFPNIFVCVCFLSFQCLLIRLLEFLYDAFFFVTCLCGVRFVSILALFFRCSEHTCYLCLDVSLFFSDTWLFCLLF